MIRTHQFGNIFKYSYIHGDLGEPNESVVYTDVEFLKDVGDHIKAGDVVWYVKFDCIQGMMWVLEVTHDMDEILDEPRKFPVWA